MKHATPRINTKGFTLVELLITVAIIAILAIITIVTYNGITSRARDVATRSDFAAIAKKMTTEQLRKGTAPNVELIRKELVVLTLPGEEVNELANLNRGSYVATNPSSGLPVDGGAVSIWGTLAYLQGQLGEPDDPLSGRMKEYCLARVTPDGSVLLVASYDNPAVQEISAEELPLRDSGPLKVVCATSRTDRPTDGYDDQYWAQRITAVKTAAGKILLVRELNISV